MKKSDAEKRILQGNGHSCHLCCGESESSSGQDVQICIESLTTPHPPTPKLRLLIFKLNFSFECFYIQD